MKVHTRIQRNVLCSGMFIFKYTKKYKMNLVVDSIVISHEGKKRKNNEDNFNIFGKIREDITKNRSAYKCKHLASDGLVAIFDGMGGEEAGEIASLIAAQNISWHSLDDLEEKSLKELNEVNAKVCNEATKRNVRCVGTTYTGLYFDENWARCCNVGDSRCYMYRNNQLYILSKDHTKGQQLMDKGEMTEREARSSKAWHQLSQNIGLPPEICKLKPHYSTLLELNSNDIFLLCSDGLTDLVVDREIAKVLSMKKSIVYKCRKLLNLALEKGGKDNITVIVLEIKEKGRLVGLKNKNGV